MFISLLLEITLQEAFAQGDNPPKSIGAKNKIARMAGFFFGSLADFSTNS